MLLTFERNPVMIAPGTRVFSLPSTYGCFSDGEAIVIRVLVINIDII